MIAAITISIACIAWLILTGLWLRLDAKITRTDQRLRVLVGAYDDAGMLAQSRQRFRQNQRRVEDAVATGTSGVETLHRTLSRMFGGRPDSGAAGYDRVRAFNRGFGKTVSGLFAPGPRRHSESLEDWRARQSDDDHHSEERRDE